MYDTGSFVFFVVFFATGHTRVFAYYNIGLAGFFIGIGEILGKASLPLFLYSLLLLFIARLGEGHVLYCRLITYV